VFLPVEQIDRTCLRQGDILSAVPFPIIDDELVALGRLNHDRIEIPHPSIITVPREHRGRADCFTGQVKLRLVSCAVISHCCDLELRHGNVNLLMVTVARLIPIKTSILRDPGKIASLRANKDPRNIADPGYIDYFYLEPHEALSSAELVVDFGQMSAVLGSEYTRLLSKKVLQLRDRDRVKFKIKLASYFGRLTDEESALNIENPWEDTSPEQQQAEDS
jgi:hypothetical protein